MIAVLLAGCATVQHRPGLVGGSHAEQHFVALRLSARPTVPTGSVSRLAAGRWSELPRAPIAPRLDASVVWTGRELLVWGGASGDQGEDLRSDGAGYDPATGRWRLLAPAPLSGRQGQAAVWTGREMVVWGGYDDVSAHDFRVAGDGAAYDASSNMWRLLPPAPLSARTNSIAVWTGRDVVLLGGQPAVLTDSLRSFADGAAYDPALNRWTPIAPPVPPRGHGLDWVAAVQAGGQLFAWSDWSITHQTGPGSFSERGGVDLFGYNEQTGRWRLLRTEPNELPAVDTALWTGQAVLVRGITYNCGSCTGPFVPEATDVFNPASNSWRRLPPDPLGSNEPLSAWTGAALVSFIGSGQFGSIGPGSTAAYDPLRNVWRRLPQAPFGCDGSQAPVWTGQALLLYCPRNGRGAAGRHDGLAFTPAPSSTLTAHNKPGASASASLSSVPRLVGRSAVSAYARLHRAGLRVTIPHRVGARPACESGRGRATSRAPSWESPPALAPARNPVPVVVTSCGAATNRSTVTGTGQPTSYAQAVNAACNADGTNRTMVNTSCVFVLADGRRFSCPPRFAHAVQTASSLERSRSCRTIAPLHLSAAGRQ
jgi:hypothetical protein